MRVGELPQSFLPLLAPVTAVAAAAEGHRGVHGEHQGIVDAGHSHTEATGDGFAAVAAEDSAAESVPAGVDVSDGLLGVGDLDDRQRRAERLLRRREGVGGHSDQDGGRDIAVAHRVEATDSGCRAALQSLLDVFPDDRGLAGQGNRPDLGVIVAADAYLPGQVADLLDELVVNGLDDVGHFETDAAVPGVLHGAPHDVGGGFVQVGVLGDDDTVLATEFQQNGGQGLRALGGHRPARRDAAREREFVQAGLDERLARGPVSVQVLQDGGKVRNGPLPGPNEPFSHAGRDLAGLEDDGVPGRERVGEDGCGSEQGEVPRADDADHAVGLVFDPCALVGHGGAGRNLPASQDARGVVSGVLQVLESPEHFHAGVVEGLAVLGVNECGALLAAQSYLPPPRTQPLRTALETEVPPGPGDRTCGSDSRDRLFRARYGVSRELGSGGLVDGDDLARVVSDDAVTCDRRSVVGHGFLPLSYARPCEPHPWVKAGGGRGLGHEGPLNGSRPGLHE